MDNELGKEIKEFMEYWDRLIIIILKNGIRTSGSRV